MSRTITIKDHNGNDVVFTYTGTKGDAQVFDAASESLLGRKRIEIGLKANANVNRVSVKLSLPRVCVNEVSCDVPKVSYVQVASADLSVVRFSSEADRKDLAALFASLMANTDVDTLITDGIMPQ